MNEYIIKRLARDWESFSIKADDEYKAVEIFKSYGQYNPRGVYYIYLATYETFSDMVRQDLSIVSEF